MKRSLYMAMILLCAASVSCSKYAVKDEIDDVSNIKDPKKMGVVLRVSQKGRVGRDDILNGISRSLAGFKHVTQVEMVPDLSSKTYEFMEDDLRFYQNDSSERNIITNKEGFLKYKCIGIMKNYLRDQETELKGAIAKDSLDGIIIYEIYTVVSVEMQMMKIESVVAVADKDLNIVYLDHQSNIMDSDNNDYASLKTEAVNHLTARFAEKMLDFGYFEEL